MTTPGDRLHRVDDRQARRQRAGLERARRQRDPGDAQRDQRPRLPVGQEPRTCPRARSDRVKLAVTAAVSPNTTPAAAGQQPRPGRPPGHPAQADGHRGDHHDDAEDQHPAPGGHLRPARGRRRDGQEHRHPGRDQQAARPSPGAAAAAATSAPPAAARTAGRPPRSARPGSAARRPAPSPAARKRRWPAPARPATAAAGPRRPAAAATSPRRCGASPGLPVLERGGHAERARRRQRGERRDRESASAVHGQAAPPRSRSPHLHLPCVQSTIRACPAHGPLMVIA